MGYTAWIDLNNREIELEETPPEMLEKFLGSRGYSAKLLYDRVGPEVEPFSAENLLIFAPGLLTGTPWPTGARYTVTAKSPLTGAYGYSNASGFFGPELRKAGFDALVFRGCSDKPVYLLVEDDKLQLLPAEEYWGEMTLDTEAALQEKHPDCRVAAIGPAGENLVRVASVINDKGRAAARCGLGAVMGFKKLKAIAVKATEEVQVPERFKEKAREMMKKAATHPGSKSLRQWGTAELIDPKNQSGDLPTRNHRQLQFEAGTRINAEALDEFVYQNTGCYSCPIRCSRLSRVESGSYQTETEGPEYETINAFGPLVGNNDLELIIYANRLCNELGIDTISTGVIIAFVMECHENGLLEMDDINLEWGNKDAIIKLINKIAYRQDEGDILAEGVYRAAGKINDRAEEFALHVKGMEIPMQEPRVCKAMGLGHATSNRGADHLYGLPTIDLTGNVEVAERYFPGMMPEILEVTSQKYKPEMLCFTQKYNAISDALGVCKFSTTENFALLPEDVAAGLQELADFEMDGEKLLRAGERIINLERMYNYRHGFDRSYDQLPARFTSEPASVYRLQNGELTGEVVEDGLIVELDEMLDRYYQLRNWDQKGVPTADKLRELGLEELVQDL